MRLITVNAYEIALVIKRGKLINVLTEGRYWIGFYRKIERYNVTQPIVIDLDRELVFTNPILRNYLEIIDIQDNQLGLEMKEGKYMRVLQTGKYGYWKSSLNYRVELIDLNEVEVQADLPRYILMKPDMLRYLNVYPVESYQKGLLYIDGEYVKTLDPGVYYYWKSDKTATVKVIETRIQLMEVAGQEILTKDKVGIRLNFSLQYQVTDIVKALVDALDYVKQLYITIQLILREYIGTMTLDQLLSNKESIGPYVVKISNEISGLLGVQIITGGIKDIILPGDVRDIMNQVLIAQKQAQANTIMRQEEIASTRSLLNTAKLMEQNAMLMKLKEMEYMEKIAQKIGEISINGKGRVVDQLAELLVTGKS